jgi:hypothetical protein
MAVNLELLGDGSVSGVLGAVNSHALMLEHGDDSSLGRSGDPFTCRSIRCGE